MDAAHKHFMGACVKQHPLCCSARKLFCHNARRYGTLDTLAGLYKARFIPTLNTSPLPVFV
jgi:hypothetical protein